MAKIIIPASVLEDYSDVIDITLTSFSVSDSWIGIDWASRAGGSEPTIEYDIDITDDITIETDDFVEREELEEAQQRILELEQMIEEKDNKIKELSVPFLTAIKQLFN